MHPYHKRYYHRLSELGQDVCAVARQRKEVRRLGGGAAIDKAFQERLMLAVTEVNGCRYCAFAHTRVALAAGVPHSEVAALIGGHMEQAPPEQVPALLYAQHWAETDAQPEPDARAAVLATYGAEKMAAIESSLRAIRVGNLLGNTGDYLLYRVSFGRWARPKARPAT